MILLRPVFDPPRSVPQFQGLMRRIAVPERDPAALR